MTLAYGTLIATPQGARPIEAFAVGDTVDAASLVGGELQWTARTVELSDGALPAGQVMVWLAWDDNQSLIVTRDQPFLLAGGRIERAERLTPGRDQLVKADGEPAMLLHVSLGDWQGGVHAIATSRRFEGIDNHLIAAGGMVVGDYILETEDPSGRAPS